jgi:hypothetical protein
MHEKRMAGRSATDATCSLDVAFVEKNLSMHKMKFDGATYVKNGMIPVFPKNTAAKNGRKNNSTGMTGIINLLEVYMQKRAAN